MSNPPEQRGASPLRIAAAALTLVITAGLSFAFARAVSDSRSYAAASEFAVVDPTYVADGRTALKQIPDFTLEDRFGRPVALADFQGVDLLIVNIWTVGCPACEAELPSLEEMDRRLPSIGRVALLTIAANETWEEVAHLFPNGTDLRILFDPDKTVTETLFGTSRYPETFVLDAERRVRARFDGQRLWHADEMLRYVSSFE